MSKRKFFFHQEFKKYSSFIPYCKQVFVCKNFFCLVKTILCFIKRICFLLPFFTIFIDFISIFHSVHHFNCGKEENAVLLKRTFISASLIFSFFHLPLLQRSVLLCNKAESGKMKNGAKNKKILCLLAI